MWGFAGSAARIVVQFGAQIVLARLLGPEQYGLYALAVAVVGFFVFFTDTGVSHALVQQPEVTDGDLRFAFTCQFAGGLVVTTALILTADLAAAFFRSAEVGSVIRGLSLVCLLQAISMVSMNVLRRRLDMKRLQLAQVGSYFIGYVLVGIPMAVLGFGVWALVISWCVQSVANFLIMFEGVRHPLRLTAWVSNGRSLLTYGRLVFVTNLTNWLLGNVDRVIVGRAFAPHAVGVYATSYNLMSYGTTAVQTVLQNVFFSAGSKIQGDTERLGRAALVLIEAIALFVVPAFVFVAATSERMILTLYGAAWKEAAGPLVPFALAMPFMLFLAVATPVLWNSGRSRSEWLVQLPMIVLWAVVSWVAAQTSLVAVAWAVFALFVLRAAVFMALVSRALRLSLRSVARRCLCGSVVAMAVGGCGFFVDTMVAGSTPAVAGFLADLAAAITVGSITGWVLRRHTSIELRQICSHLISGFETHCGIQTRARAQSCEPDSR